MLRIATWLGIFAACVGFAIIGLPLVPIAIAGASACAGTLVAGRSGGWSELEAPKSTLDQLADEWLKEAPDDSWIPTDKRRRYKELRQALDQGVIEPHEHEAGLDELLFDKPNPWAEDMAKRMNPPQPARKSGPFGEETVEIDQTGHRHTVIYGEETHGNPLDSDCTCGFCDDTRQRMLMDASFDVEQIAGDIMSAHSVPPLMMFDKKSCPRCDGRKPKSGFKEKFWNDGLTKLCNDCAGYGASPIKTLEERKSDHERQQRALQAAMVKDRAVVSRHFGRTSYCPYCQAGLYIREGDTVVQCASCRHWMSTLEPVIHPSNQASRIATETARMIQRNLAAQGKVFAVPIDASLQRMQSKYRRGR